ncbi:MAG: DHH family phosphoesterase [Lentisphaeria bacterium]|nr:DHH family phosphoesterase [Lentisphaeria bacterium]
MARQRTRTNPQRCSRLMTLMAGAESMLIVLQDSPDPDALAAAAALRVIANQKGGIACTLAHGGTIGRAENVALAKYLALSLRPATEVTPERFDLVALVDTQPGTGNNLLPPGHIPQIVIDHHPVRRLTRSSPYTDIRRRYGATSTILSEYLDTLRIVPDRPLATALLYGIRADTQNLGREASQADLAAHLKLYPMANLRMLARIQMAAVPREYFQVLGEALHNAVFAGRAVFCALRHLGNPDMVPEVADLLLRFEECDWVLVCGLSGERLHLSLRCRPDLDVEAGKAIQRIIGHHGSGGGHDSMAGGRIDLGHKPAAPVLRGVSRRFFALAGAESSPPRHLVERHPGRV